MKPKNILWVTLFFTILVTIFVAISFNHSIALAQNPKADTAASLQITPTPAIAALSEIGSTDGIVIMGFVIVLIVITSILFYRPKS